MIRPTLAAAAFMIASVMMAPTVGMACAVPKASEALQAEALKAVNAERASHGLRALKFSRTLDKAAQGAACDNANRRAITHVSSDGSRLKDRLHRVGYRYRSAAENTGRGFRSGTSAVQWWMDSPKHKANILMGSVREIGIGIALSAAPDNKLHWILNMGQEK